MRIGLARLLLSEPELLVMDEPTNQLGVTVRKWLAEYVAAYQGTVSVISHGESFVKDACILPSTRIRDFISSWDYTS